VPIRVSKIGIISSIFIPYYLLLSGLLSGYLYYYYSPTSLLLLLYYSINLYLLKVNKRVILDKKSQPIIGLFPYKK